MTETIIALALEEDLDEHGDVTSEFCLSPGQIGAAAIYAKEPGVLCGIEVVSDVCRKVDSDLVVKYRMKDGDSVEPGDEVMTIRGRTVSILKAERTALNFLQRLSGTATLTRKYVRAVVGTKARILDTRKTTPGLRKLQKYAVAIGGGQNHRFGLFDMVLLKENHLRAAGGVLAAVQSVRQRMRETSHVLKIEVEVTNMSEVEQALAAHVDRVMLDNMPVSEIREAVHFLSGRVETEVSGGVTLDTVAEKAATGVDFISVGALTHSAPALDFSLLVLDGE